LDTNSWLGSAGLNSQPNGPVAWAAIGEVGAAVSRPWRLTLRLSISDGPTRVPIRAVPVELNNTSPSWEPSGTDTVELARGCERSLGPSVNPVQLESVGPALAT
jgi:hypothetical protein